MTRRDSSTRLPPAKHGCRPMDYIFAMMPQPMRPPEPPMGWAM